MGSPGTRPAAAQEPKKLLKFDVEPERAVKAGDGGFVTLRRAKEFAL